MLPGHEFSGEFIAHEQGGVGGKGSDDGHIDACGQGTSSINAIVVIIIGPSQGQ